jgi:hypothetical protein
MISTATDLQMSSVQQRERRAAVFHFVRRRLPTAATATTPCARSTRTRPSSATSASTTIAILLIDEDLFIDLDGDGFGNRTASHRTARRSTRSPTATIAMTRRCRSPLGNFSHPGLTETLCDGLDNDCNAATPDSRARRATAIDTDCNCGLYNDPMTVLEPSTPFVPTCNCTVD